MNKLHKYGLFLVLLAGFILEVQCVDKHTVYEVASNIIELTPENFDALVTNDDAVWAVQFYSTWCHFCQALAPEWLKVSDTLEGKIKMGVVNVPRYQNLGRRFHVMGFPTILIFGEDKTRPTRYNGPRAAPEMTQYFYAVSQARKK